MTPPSKDGVCAPKFDQRILIPTGPGLAIHDITGELRACVARAGITEGFAVLSSRHTTTAITVNENEARLLEDVRRFFLRLAPPEGRYLHNDIHLRDCPPDEPENAHAHLIAMMLGNSESLPIHGGEIDLGRWQSVLLVELDGPRERSVAVQIWGE